MWPATDGSWLNTARFKSGFIYILKHCRDGCCRMLMGHERNWVQYMCQKTKKEMVFCCVNPVVWSSCLNGKTCVTFILQSLQNTSKGPFHDPFHRMIHYLFPHFPKVEGTEMPPFFSLRPSGCILINIVCKWNVTPFNVRALWEMSIEMSSGCRDVEPEGLMSSVVQ